MMKYWQSDDPLFHFQDPVNTCQWSCYICSIPPSALSIPAFEAQAANKEAIKIYVVKANSQSSSEAILRATSSDSDAFYFPTPIPATAPVYNPTPLNLKDNKLQQLKDAQRKRII